MPFDNLSFGHVDADTRTLRAAMTVPPPAGRLWQIDQTIRQLKQHGIWQKLDVLWMLAAHDAQAARLNWKNPAQFALTAVNSPTFTADRGYAGNGTTSYLNTNWNPFSNGVLFVQNTAHVSLWNRSAISDNDNAIGVWNGNGITMCPSRSVAPAGYEARINQATAENVANTSANAPGFYIANRSGASATQHYKNGASLVTGTQTSTIPVNGTVQIGAISSISQFAANEIASASLGGSLTTAEAAAFYSILQTHMNRIGA